MEVERNDLPEDPELRNVLLSGFDITRPGAVINNCILLFGSNEGKCAICMKPCLHPLATEDLKLFFHNDDIVMFDWIDDSSCIIVCKDQSVVSDIISQFFKIIYTEESGIEWYQSNEVIKKQVESDKYGEQGVSIHIYARNCLTSDVEHKKELQKGKMVNRIIKKRRQLKQQKEKQAIKVVARREKKRRQRERRKQKKKEAKLMEQQSTPTLETTPINE